jgi:hypothetical protein
MSMSSAAIASFEITLGALSKLLDKAEAHCASKKIDPSVLLGYRLAPDMFALARQVQIACDLAKFGAARLSGAEPPKFKDNEKTIPELKSVSSKRSPSSKASTARRLTPQPAAPSLSRSAQRRAR